MQTKSLIRRDFEGQSRRGAHPRKSAADNELTRMWRCAKVCSLLRLLAAQFARDTFTDGSRKATSSPGNSRPLMETITYCCPFNM